MLVNHLAEIHLKYSTVCLDASIKLGLTTLKIQPVLYSAARSLYISHLLPQLHQHFSFFFLSYSFLTPFISMSISYIFIFSCSSFSAPWFPLIINQVQNSILEYHETLPLDILLYYFLHYSCSLKELSDLFGLSLCFLQ